MDFAGTSQRLGAALHTAAELLRSMHAPDYRDAKARDLEWFCVTVTFLTAAFTATTWIWDYVIDPVNSRDTVTLRTLATLTVLAVGFAMRRGVLTAIARLAILTGALSVELLHIEILSRLDQGPLYGMGGFLYFYIFAPLVCCAQSLRFNVLVVTALALLPTVVSPSGLTAHLNMPIYHVYVWMIYGPIVAILVLFEALYLAVYRYRRELERWAVTDPLTGLPNRRHFLAVSRRLLRAAKRTGDPTAVLFLDVDHFKRFNDVEGHAAGDRVLQGLSTAVVSVLRESDVVGRYGGEEFVVYLHAADASVARDTAERIRLAARDRSAASQPITVSIGIASTEGTDCAGVGVETLIERADKALYAAKRGGRDRVVCDREYASASLKTPAVVPMATSYGDHP